MSAGSGRSSTSGPATAATPAFDRHPPHGGGFGERSPSRPGGGASPVFAPAGGRVGVRISSARHFPEGWRALGLNGAQIVFNPSATSRGLSEYLWSIEQPAAAVAN